MGTVDALRVDAVDLAHALHQVRFWRFNEDVVVVGHLTPGMADPVKSPADLTKHFQPRFPVCVGQIDIITHVTPRGDVAHTAR